MPDRPYVDAGPHGEPPSRASRWAVLGLGVALALTVLAVLLWLMLPRVRLSEEEVRTAVAARIQREAPESFLVTGSLDLTATTTVRNTRYVLPEPIRLSLGTTSATVRLPGKAFYGFDVRRLEPDRIQFRDSVVEVVLPEVQVLSVDADVSAMEVQTEVGWARLHSGSGQAAERAAWSRAEEALREQAGQHVADSDQPAIHTARALELMLRPVLEALGVEDPRFRFRIGPRITVEGGRALEGGPSQP